MLRVRTGHEYPEGNRRELLGDSKLNCGIAKEREKINWPEHTAGRSQNKGSEQVHRRASRLRAAQPRRRQEAGDGANSAPKTTLQTGLQFLTKDFLGFWMVDILQEGGG